MNAPSLLDHSRLTALPKVEFIQVDARVQLRSAYWAGGDRGLVHIFQGRAEYIEKYQDVISAFLARGFDVVAHDWRDQGLSTRNPHNPLRNIIKSYSEYEADARAIIDHYAYIEKPRIFFAHSMGGAIGLPFLKREPDLFKGAIFSAPLWDFALPKFVYPIRWIMAMFGILIGKRYSTMPGTGDQRYELVNSFEGNSFTNSRENWDWIVSLASAHKGLTKWGPTYAWFIASLSQIAKNKLLRNIKVPALITLGRKDKIVSQRVIHKFAKRHKSFNLKIHENGRHQDYIESDDIKKALWEEIDTFLTKISL